MKENARKVLYWMKHLGDEFEYLATSPLQDKLKVMLLMVYVDIFSQIWWQFICHGDRRGTQKGRFSSWSDEFVFSNRNRYYFKNKYEFHLLNGKTLYKIRNSLLHFGGLPSIANTPIFISSYTRREFCERYSQKIGDKEVLVLCPRILFVAVATAISLTIETLLEETNRTSNTEEDILQNIYERIQHDWGLPINTKDT